MKDKFTKKAFSEGYLARSIYKLKEIDKEYHLIKKGDNVLDLGAAPGSWSQFTKEMGAKVTAVDLNKINVPEIKIINSDIFDNDILNKLDLTYDLILSDLAPKTIGILNLDNERSCNLCKKALIISKKKIKQKWKFFM